MYPIIIPAGMPRKEIDDYYFNKHLSRNEIVANLRQLKKEINEDFKYELSGTNFYEKQDGGGKNNEDKEKTRKRTVYKTQSPYFPGQYLSSTSYNKKSKNRNAMVNAGKAIESGKDAVNTTASTNVIGAVGVGAISGYARSGNPFGAAVGGATGYLIHRATNNCIQKGTTEVRKNSRKTNGSNTNILLQIVSYLAIIFFAYNFAAGTLSLSFQKGGGDEEHEIRKDAEVVYSEIEKIMQKDDFAEWKSKMEALVKDKPIVDTGVIHMEDYFEAMALLNEYLKEYPNNNQKNNTRKLKRN